MPENNEMNVNVTEENTTPEVLPEYAPLATADANSKQDLVIGIAGAAVILLAIPTVVRGVKWVVNKVKDVAAKKKAEPETESEQ